MFFFSFWVKVFIWRMPIESRRSRPCGARVIRDLRIDYSHDPTHHPVISFSSRRKRKSFRLRMLWRSGRRPPVGYRSRWSIFSISKLRTRRRSANLKIEYVKTYFLKASKFLKRMYTPKEAAAFVIAKRKL